MPDLVPVRRALLSVSDKTGLVEFAQTLHQQFGVQLLSTGGTAKALRDAGLPVTDVSEVTGFPEMMDGRVKTLHPKIHGGLLGRLPQDESVMAEHGIQAIDLVVINLYPFDATVAKPNVTEEEAIENIDIGGPSMVRSAAKNFSRVAVLTQPHHLQRVMEELQTNNGSTSLQLRKQLMAEAFATTRSYDQSVAAWFGRHFGDAAATEENALPAKLTMSLSIKQSLRYGENPHQSAGLYTDVSHPQSSGTIAGAKQLHGKALSYINLLDADAALNCAREFNGAADASCCIVKHATPCGAAAVANRQQDAQATAFTKALAGDPVAAFGGIVAFNQPLNLATARAMTEGKTFLEVIVAPSFNDDALAVLQERWKNVRLLAVGEIAASPDVMLHKISGGYLVQQADTQSAQMADWNAVTQRQPTEQELADLRLAWLVCKHVKSNAIVLARDGATIGIGGGQVDRVGACEIAVRKASSRAVGAVAASDAFFPFPDGPNLLLEAGVTAIVQPGGSVRDAETITTVEQKQAAMVFTGVRHFRH